jgi:hypothetical protein
VSPLPAHPPEETAQAPPVIGIPFPNAKKPVTLKCILLANPKKAVTLKRIPLPYAKKAVTLEGVHRCPHVTGGLRRQEEEGKTRRRWVLALEAQKHQEANLVPLSPNVGIHIRCRSVEQQMIKVSFSYFLSLLMFLT